MRQKVLFGQFPHVQENHELNADNEGILRGKLFSTRESYYTQLIITPLSSTIPLRFLQVRQDLLTFCAS